MKKILSITTILIMTNIISVSFANSILYKKATITPISTGTNLTEYDILTEDGWIKANVISLDINDDYDKIGLLTSISGDRYLNTTQKMASDNKAIAGINADFFAGRNGVGHSIGLAIDDFMVASSATNLNNEENKYASYLLNDNNKVFFDYISSNITAVFDEELIINIRDINKYSDDYSTASIFNEKFGKFSIGSSDELPLTEIVVQNDRVVEIRNLDGWCVIPENGYVISVLNNVYNEWPYQIEVGSKVKIETEYTPDINNIRFAISGGAKLVENGIIPD